MLFLYHLNQLNVVSNEDFYKREEDRKWRERVDTRIASLTTDLTVIHDRLDSLEARLDEIDDVLNGKPGEKSKGLESRLDSLETKANLSHALLVGDYSGTTGIVHDVNFLMDKKRIRYAERTVMRPAQIALLGTLVAALIAAMTAIIVNWSAVKKTLFSTEPNALEQMIDNAKHPKPKHRHYVIPEDSD